MGPRPPPPPAQPPSLSLADLPDAAWGEVAACLEPEDLGRLACVSRELHELLPPHVPALFHYAEKGDAEAVRRLLQLPCFDVECDIPLVHHRGSTEMTVLQVSAAKGHAVVLAAVLAVAPQDYLDQELKDFPMPLFYACAAGHPAAVAALVGAGANVSAADEGGETALMAACQAGSRGAADHLIAAGAPVNAADDGGCTALMRAAARNCVGAMDSLLAAGADVAALDSEGRSALVLALTHCKTPAAIRLLEAGAELAAEDVQEASRARRAAGAEAKMWPDTLVAWSLNQGRLDIVEAVLNGLEPAQPSV